MLPVRLSELPDALTEPFVQLMVPPPEPPPAVALTSTSPPSNALLRSPTLSVELSLVVSQQAAVLHATVKVLAPVLMVISDGSSNKVPALPFGARRSAKPAKT